MATVPSSPEPGLWLATEFLVNLRKEIQRAGGDPDADLTQEIMGSTLLMGRMARLIMMARHEAIDCVDQILRCTMDTSVGISDLIGRGGYDRVDANIVERSTLQTRNGVEHRDVILLHVNERAATQNLLEMIGRFGLRPVTLHELLWVGIQHPNIQREAPIVSLSPVAKVLAYPCAAYLGRYEEEKRELGLARLNTFWPKSCRFAAVSARLR